MKLFITGATGFIGKHLVSKLNSEGHTLFISLLPNEENPFKEIATTDFVVAGDYIQDLILFLAEQHIDGVIHLASYVQSGEHKTDDIEKLIDTNVKFSTVILEAAVAAHVRWFINTGTYWQHYNNEAYSPVNMYAATKQAFIDIAKYYWDCQKIQFNTLMLYDTYGSNDTRPKIFTLWERIARTGETLDMSAGEQVIDISHVDDVVIQFTELANALYTNAATIANGEVYAVRAPQRYTLRQLAAKYETDHQVKLNINWGAKPYRDREVMMPWENGKVLR